MLRSATITSLVALAAAGLSPALAQSADPTAAGFTEEGLAALDAYFAGLADEKVRPGYVVGIARNGEIVHMAASGLQNVAAGTPMAIDSRFRLASMTKPVTVVAVLTLVDAGKIDLDEPVSVHLPNMANMLVASSTTKNAEGGFDLSPQSPPMTIRHLLTHTAGLGYALDRQTDLGNHYLENTLYDGDGDLAASIDQLTAMPLYFQPGTTWSYSWSMDVLGRVVEVASGMAYDDYLQTAIFDPLGMTSTHFFREPEDAAKLVPVYGHAEDGSFVERENVTFGGDETFPSGGGGLFSTLPDYLRFAAMLANDGALGDVRILKPETVALMGTPQLEPGQFPPRFLGYGVEGRNFGLGVQVVVDAEATPQVDVDGEFGWNGAYNTEFFIDPENDLAAVILTAYQGGGPSAPAADTGGDLRKWVYGAMATSE